MFLLSLIQLGLHRLKLALRLLCTLLPLLSTLSGLEKTLPRRLHNLLVVRGLVLVLLHTTLKSRVLALEDFAAIANTAKLLQLLSIDLAH